MKYNIKMSPCENFYLEGAENQMMPFVGDVLLEIAEREGIDLTGIGFHSESHLWQHLEHMGVRITGVN